MKVHTEAYPQHPQSNNPFIKVLDKWLVGKSSSDPAHYSQKWIQKFSLRPTWCDADMALQQMNRGLATGNRVALYARSLFQSLLFSLGSFIQDRAWPVLIIGFFAYLVCSFGLQYVHIEADMVKLWVPQNGRLNDELHFLTRVQTESEIAISRSKRQTENTTSDGSVAIKPVGGSRGSIKKEVDEKPRQNAFGNGFQVLIQTASEDGTNALTKEMLLKHVQIMEEIAQFKIEMFGENWTLADLCFKPPAPTMPKSPLTGLLTNLLERIIPCIWITPIDCFWEGSKPLGPSPPLNFGPDAQAFLSSLPNGNVTWKNLDPSAVLKEVGALFDLSTVLNMFDRAGIGAAYQDRLCIDPLDPECPRTAPNAFDRCAAFRKFNEWNSQKPTDEQIVLEGDDTIVVSAPPVQLDPAAEIIENIFGENKRRKRDNEVVPVDTNSTGTTADDYYAYEDEDEYDAQLNDSRTKDPNQQLCAKFGIGLINWMDKNQDRWKEFLTEDEMPKYPDYGQVMTGGCRGFARKTMIWPEDLIIGGIKRNKNRMLSAEAFQSVFLVASGSDVYLRFKEPKPELKPKLNTHAWNPSIAGQVVSAWQRSFTKLIYEHRWNSQEKRVVHPLASTSLEDMLEEFSQFNFGIIAVGYFLMFVYAGWTQMKWDGSWFAVDSSSCLGIFGVLVVTYASISGLGLSSWIGIHFNAATTQIVPFLTLGLGVDDMFLLLHNYNEIIHEIKHNEIGILMKETGMSIVITSVNNIIAFMTGTLLPIPALRSFCSQTAILLSFNMVAIMILYPALISLDLRRRRAGRRDLGCCCLGSDEETKKLGNETFEIGAAKGAPLSLALPGHIYPGPPQNLSSSSLKTKSFDVKDDDLKWYTLQGFLEYHYIPFLRRPTTKFIVLTVCSLMFLLGFTGIYKSTLGLELSDVLPERTAPGAFLRAREKYFSFYPMLMVLKGNEIDFPKQQEMIEQYRLDIAKCEFVIKVNGRPSEEYWLSLMRTWLVSIQEHLDEAIKKGDISVTTGLVKNGAKLTTEAKIARHLICSYGLTFNCTDRIGTVSLVDSSGVINSEGFYNYLTAWYNIDNMMYYVSQAAFYPTPPAWSLSAGEKAVPPAQPPAFSQIPFYLTDLVDTPLVVKMIREIRNTCDTYTEVGLPNFPSGVVFIFWEQYLHLSWNLFVAICVIAISVFLIISFLIFNPWASLMVMIIVVSMTIELGGFMAIIGVKLNPVSAVTMVTAVGIGVEFTAHVVLAYLTSLGTRNERMAACLDHMFVPVLHGGLSTLLGIIMLAFSEFEFIVKYFFVVLAALIVIGLINGLVLLPVLLSLIGPPCEIHPSDGKKYLPVPPVYSKQYQSTNDGRVVGSFVEMQVNGGKKKDLEQQFNDPLSTIAEECDNSHRKVATMIAAPFDGNPTSVVRKKMVTNTDGVTSPTLPIGVVAPQRSTSPLLAASELDDDSNGTKGSGRPFKFTSNALRF